MKNIVSSASHALSFITGVSLGGISFFNRISRRLTLSNGESWPVNTANTIPDRRQKDCIFSIESMSNGREQYIIRWKSGVTEHLSLVGGNIYATSCIYSPIEKTVKLEWSWNGSSALLQMISDQHSDLCRFQYRSSGMTMTLWPQTVEECRFTFVLQNGQLSSITRPVSDTKSMEWKMTYKLEGPSDNQISLLTSVTAPTGLIDTIIYAKQKGLDFPSESGLKWLPAVESHTRNFGRGQPLQTKRFNYTSNNFLGRNASIDTFGSWHMERDFIYSILTKSYTYGSTETISTPNETFTIIRTYNNYHFLISEKTSRSGCETLTETDYYAEIGKPSNLQPAQYMLPMKRSATFRDIGNHSRIEETITQFDEYGNPTYSVAPDGTVTKCEYYPAEGDGDDCPPDQNGFIRFLKQKTIEPRATTFNDTPKHITRYAYSRLGNRNYVVQKSISEYTDKPDMELLNQRNFTYQDDVNSSNFGRITAISDEKYENGENSKRFVAQQDFDISVNNGVLIQTVSFTGHDGLSYSFVRHQSVYSGLVLSETSSQGLITQFTYDAFGRLIRRSVCPNSEYENTSTWEHEVDADGPCSIETDTLGNKIKKVFDGAGRIISQHKFDADTSAWYSTSSFAYNSLGEAINGVVNDWLPGSDTCIPLTSNITYGGWGEKKLAMFSDGRQMHKQIDPIALTQKNYSQGTASKSGSLISGSSITTHDQRSQLPISEELKEITGEQYSLCSFSYDGLGRLREETDVLGAITKRTYDEYGRVLTQTLPDESIVSRTYAPHLTGDQIASISVSGKDGNGNPQTWLMGTQTFDSLGRVTKRVSGGRTTLYTYHGASPVASVITLPSGKTVTYDYIPELGNAINSVTADGITQTFSYDKKTGKLLKAREAGSEIENTWSLANQLKSEEFLHDSNGQKRKAEYTHTLNGVPVKYVDVSGKKMQYNMDSFGRVTRINDDDLKVDLSYDSLGRVSKQVICDMASTSSLTTVLNYDSFGHEITRTITNDHGMTLVMSQTWLKNDLLAGRVTSKNGVKIRDESYGYDRRNRLISYRVVGSSMPVDQYGHQMINQNYCYDALNNLISVDTTLFDHTTNKATYVYGNNNDPTQLTAVHHTHQAYPATINLSYDVEGRMICDEAGRTLTYDVMGRLKSVSEKSGQGQSQGTYTYDALNRLITRNVDKSNNDVCQLYYRGTELVNEITASAHKETRMIKNGHTCLGLSEASGLTLTAGDRNDSLIWSADANKEGQLHVWSPYGSGVSSNKCLPGFNGERLDPVSGTYHLGNGYRAYNPVLMRFNCPDSLSPFGAGGINPYAYCAGDPINHTDPSGHLSWQAITGIVLGVAGLAFAVFTAGASIAAAGGVMAALSSASTASLIIGGLGVASDVTAIVSGAMEDYSPEASNILGWVSLATGLAGLTMAGGGFAAKKFAGRYRPNTADIFNVGSAPTRPLRDAPKNQSMWHAVSPEGKTNKIFGADRVITGTHIEEPLRILEGIPDHRDVYILTGTHGQRYGHNWRLVENPPHFSESHSVARAEGLPDVEFFVEDVGSYLRRNRDIARNLNVHIVDMVNGLTFDQFEASIKAGDIDVILGYCFGRNDDALRYFLNLPPVISYV